MIKAKITVFDDETGQVFEKDRVIEPYREEKSQGDISGCYRITHEFRFEMQRLEYMHICLRCKHFSCNKPMPYYDNQVIVKDRCTLHPGKDDALGYCDDYEADL